MECCSNCVTQIHRRTCLPRELLEFREGRRVLVAEDVGDDDERLSVLGDAAGRRRQIVREVNHSLRRRRHVRPSLGVRRVRDDGRALAEVERLAVSAC